MNGSLPNENLWSLDELCDHAFDIFEELASDNLTADDYTEYQQQHLTSGFVDLKTPDDSWEDLYPIELDPELHIEAWIGLSGSEGEADKVLARLLLNRDKDETECFAQWRGQ
ncbi:MAG: YciU family protein [Alkalimonas sp.]|nr:YciU family protein [Alkalimonas sp.]